VAERLGTSTQVSTASVIIRSVRRMKSDSLLRRSVAGRAVTEDGGKVRRVRVLRGKEEIGTAMAMSY
jgi:hypothetical protein